MFRRARESSGNVPEVCRDGGINVGGVRDGIGIGEPEEMECPLTFTPLLKGCRLDTGTGAVMDRKGRELKSRALM